MGEFDFGFDFFGSEPTKEETSQTPEVEVKSHRRTKECTELSLKYEYRRAFSEVRLLEAMRYVKLQNGTSYNFVTAGDVDSLSFLKIVLNQHKLDHLLCSTWCMAAEDILQLQEWYKGGNQWIRHVCG